MNRACTLGARLVSARRALSDASTRGFPRRLRIFDSPRDALRIRAFSPKHKFCIVVRERVLTRRRRRRRRRLLASPPLRLSGASRRLRPRRRRAVPPRQRHFPDHHLPPSHPHPTRQLQQRVLQRRVFARQRRGEPLQLRHSRSRLSFQFPLPRPRRLRRLAIRLQPRRPPTRRIIPRRVVRHRFHAFDRVARVASSSVARRPSPRHPCRSR